MTNQRDGTIIRALRNAIIEQAVKPGTRLPEDTIGEQFVNEPPAGGLKRTFLSGSETIKAAEGGVGPPQNRTI